MQPLDDLTRKKLEDLYDSALDRRELVDSILAEGRPYTPLDKDIDRPRLEGILVGKGWTTPTITDGIKFTLLDKRLRVRCEVNADTDYYVEIETDEEMNEGTILVADRGSPWSSW